MTNIGHSAEVKHGSDAALSTREKIAHVSVTAAGKLEVVSNW
jgi:hypothetical protein